MNRPGRMGKPPAAPLSARPWRAGRLRRWLGGACLSYLGFLLAANLFLATGPGRRIVLQSAARFWPGPVRLAWVAVGPGLSVHAGEVQAWLPAQGADAQEGRPEGAGREIVALGRVGVRISFGELLFGRVRPIGVALHRGRVAWDGQVMRAVREHRERRRRPGPERPPETWPAVALTADEVTLDLYGWHGEGMRGGGRYQRRGAQHVVEDVRVAGPLWEELRMSGVRDAASDTSRWDLEVAGIHGGARLLTLFPPEWQRLGSAYEMLGPADVLVRISDPGPGRPADVEARVRLRGGSVQVPFLPIPVRDLAGVLVCTREGVVSDGNVSGTFRGVPIGASIRYAGEEGRLELAAHSQDRFAFDASWADALPAEARDVWRGLDPQGEGRLSDLTVVHRRDTGTTELVGQMVLSRCLLAGLTPPLDGRDGVLDLTRVTLGKGADGEEAWLGEGNLRFEALGIGPIVMQLGEAPFAWSPEALEFGSPQRGRIRGYWARGNCEASVRIAHGMDGAEPAVAMDAAWYGADLSDILRDAGATTDYRGEFKGRFVMSQVLGRVETRTGRGRFKIKHGNLFELPVLASLPTLLWGQSRSDRTLGTAEGTFIFDGDDIVFRRAGDLLLRSHWAAVRGKGRFGLDGSLEARLLINPLDTSGWCARIPLLSRIVQGVEQGLFEVIGTGTWNDAHWQYGPGVLHVVSGMTGRGRRARGAPVEEEAVEEEPDGGEGEEPDDLPLPGEESLDGARDGHR